MQHLQRAAGKVFVLILGALLVFWTVKGTKPSGSTVLPILYGVSIGSALIWLLATWLRWRESKHRKTPDDVALNRVTLLREQYSKGGSLQRRLVVAAGFPETPEQQAEEDDRARREVCGWGLGAWRVIRDHLPGSERDFGDGDLALGDTGFHMACQREMERVGRSADTYLEGKLELIADLLRKYDS
jgi:hypothetical protein